MVTFHQFVGPALRRLMGEPGALTLPPLEAVTASRLRKKPGRVEIYRGVLHRDETGRLRVRTTGGSGSGLLHTMRDANCFIVLPEEGGTVEPGESVAIQPFFGLV
jgi:molybdopterin molybdotransferase